LLVLVFQLLPQTGDVLSVSAKSLNAAGARPPLRLLELDHVLLQNVTLDPTAELPAPTTNEPPGKNEKFVSLDVADDAK
jgi:hypothetical protein